LPDPTTVRRWAWRRLISLCQSLKFWMGTPVGQDFLLAPTILAWDWVAAGRILLLAASSP